MTRLQWTCKYLFLLFVATLLWRSATAGDADDAFEKFRNKQDSSFDAFNDRVDKQYTEFVARQDSLYNAFVTRVDKMWDDHLYPSKKDYVEYKADYSSRIHIDFEIGKVESSVLIESGADTKKLEEAKLSVIKELISSVTTTGNIDVYRSNDDDLKNQNKTPILISQVADQTGEVVKGDNAREFVEKTVATQEIAIDTVIGTDGKKRIKLTGHYELVPDHVKKRARQYLDTILKYADKYKLDPRLVLAIMHTESYFNPVATSRIPAYGLMQIVPTSAGRDAYKFVYGKDKLLKADYLYDPQNNIELGCAYLNIVRFKYLKGISEDQLAYPCAIASYNGGIGTLCKALTGTKKISRLAGAVEGDDFDSLVKKLNRKLPYKETKDYLNRVLERMPLYDEWTN